jgi:hypothetical protein
VDAGLIPDPDRIAAGVEHELAELQPEARENPSPGAAPPSAMNRQLGV